MIKKTLTALFGLYLLIFILIPLGTLLFQGFQGGVGNWVAAILSKETLEALGLTLFIMLLSLPLNAIFGVGAAWFLTRFDFPGKKSLRVLLDLPLTISPVIVGLMLILGFGQNSGLGAALERVGIQIIFSWPGLLLSSLFVTFPYVAKEVIPVLEEQGKTEEEAAVLLGAPAWKVFFKVSFPKIKWALFYGLILVAARTAGEFGASSVVSGLLRGRTVTLPIQIQIFYSEYQTQKAFASAAIFLGFALLSLILKSILETKKEGSLEH